MKENAAAPAEALPSEDALARMKRRAKQQSARDQRGHELAERKRRIQQAFDAFSIFLSGPKHDYVSEICPLFQSLRKIIVKENCAKWFARLKPKNDAEDIAIAMLRGRPSAPDRLRVFVNDASNGRLLLADAQPFNDFLVEGMRKRFWADYHNSYDGPEWKRLPVAKHPPPPTEATTAAEPPNKPATLPAGAAEAAAQPTPQVGKPPAADGDEAGHQLALDSEDIALLRALIEPGTLHNQYDLETATDLTRRTIGRRLQRLREAGLTRRPKGERGGEGITEAGLKRLQALERK